MKTLSKEQRLEKQVKLLSKQLEASLQLLAHQDKHLVFLEGLIGKSCQQEATPPDNTELQEYVLQLLKEIHE
jgi:hypothetical protein